MEVTSDANEAGGGNNRIEGPDELALVPRVIDTIINANMRAEKIDLSLARANHETSWDASVYDRGGRIRLQIPFIARRQKFHKYFTGFVNFVTAIVTSCILSSADQDALFPGVAIIRFRVRKMRMPLLERGLSVDKHLGIELWFPSADKLGAIIDTIRKFARSRLSDGRPSFGLYGKLFESDRNWRTFSSKGFQLFSDARNMGKEAGGIGRSG